MTAEKDAGPAERASEGRGVRSRLPRSAHEGFEPPATRADPIDVLEEQSAVRVPELVPIRYARMMESPFRFYRGAAALMAADLGATPHTGITVQLCGDAHMLNFRLLASPERHLMFDINDFDETLPGPFEWDVKRLATSLVIAGRANGFSTRIRRELVQDCVRGYRERMHEFAALPVLDVWYAQDNADQLEALQNKRIRGHLSRAMTQARTRTSLQAFTKLTRTEDGRRRFIADPPLITPFRDLVSGAERDDLEENLHELLRGYGDSLSSERRHLLSRFRVIDMARKVVGVGSVGTRCWVILLQGRDEGDPLILQAKEAGESVLAPYLGASEYTNEGHRVVAGQRLLQAASDIFLGWQSTVGIDGRHRDFYVRQLRDWKGVAVPENMAPATMRAFGRYCGASLARAHARSGDPIGIAAYLGRGDSFDRALVGFAEDYADQNERDHQALVNAVHTGRIPANCP
ncbi:DUF2252 domain-containing protein [Actinocorallia longicatena]|uniref:DUF2252 domain-containing protein n=1 Tax=Actinocorallia longicatena TaxID=111803 RepID=A0ABP6QCT9_9ACTN